MEEEIINNNNNDEIKDIIDNFNINNDNEIEKIYNNNIDENNKKRLNILIENPKIDLINCIIIDVKINTDDNGKSIFNFYKMLYENYSKFDLDINFINFKVLLENIIHYNSNTSLTFNFKKKIIKILLVDNSFKKLKINDIINTILAKLYFSLIDEILFYLLNIRFEIKKYYYIKKQQDYINSKINKINITIKQINKIKIKEIGEINQINQIEQTDKINQTEQKDKIEQINQIIKNKKISNIFLNYLKPDLEIQLNNLILKLLNKKININLYNINDYIKLL